MASRREQKERGHAVRLAQQRQHAERARRTHRLQTFGGVITAAVLVVVVAVAILSGGSSGGLKHGAAARALYKTVNAELTRIPEHGTTLGDPSARVTLTYFGDLQCPVCMAFTTGQEGGGLPEFIQKDVRTGKAKVRYRSLCTATCNDYRQDGDSPENTQFNTQQAAAYAAGRQSLFWYYAELFYHQQGAEGSGYATPSFIDQIAQQIPKLKLTKWKTDARSQTLHNQVIADQRLAAKRYQFSETPSFVISGPKGSSSLGSYLLNYGDLAEAVKAIS